MAIKRKSTKRSSKIRRYNPQIDDVEIAERSLLKLSEKWADQGIPDKWKSAEAVRIALVERFEGENPTGTEVKKFLKDMYRAIEITLEDLNQARLD